MNILKQNPASLAVILLLATLTLQNCSTEAPTETDQKEQTSNGLIAVDTAGIAYVSGSNPVIASGMVTSDAEQRLSFKIGGVIESIAVDEGDYVKKGQVLARLNQTEIDAQVQQATKALAKAERDLARVEGLYKDSSATLELYENAQTGRDIAKESLRIAKFNSQYATIKATRSGKVIKKLMNEGEVCGPGNPVLVIFETGANDWVVEVFVSDRDWARLRTGASAKINLDAYPDTDFRGRVSDLAPAADPMNGLYKVELRISTAGKRMAPGLFAKAEIASTQKGSKSRIPIEAVMEGDGKNAWVYTVNPDGKSIRKVAVRIARIENEFVVLENLPEGLDHVITSGAPYLNEQKQVRIQ